MKRLLVFCALVFGFNAIFADEFDWIIAQADAKCSDYEPSVVAWSKKGKALIVQGMNTEFRGGIGIILKIIDFVTDKVLASVEFHSDELPAETDKGPAILLRTTESGKKFLKLVKELDLVDTTSSQSKIKAFPYLEGASSLELKIEAYTRAFDTDEVEKLHATVRAVSNSGSKILGKTTPVIAEQILQLGYFKSPFENRIACLVLEVGPAFEGSPSLYYEFFGCKTDSGF